MHCFAILTEMLVSWRYAALSRCGSRYSLDAVFRRSLDLGLENVTMIDLFSKSSVGRLA